MVLLKNTLFKQNTINKGYGALSKDENLFFLLFINQRLLNNRKY